MASAFRAIVEGLTLQNKGEFPARDQIDYEVDSMLREADHRSGMPVCDCANRPPRPRDLGPASNLVLCNGRAHAMVLEIKSNFFGAVREA